MHSYNNNHFAISKSQFQDLKDQGHYNFEGAESWNINEVEANYNHFKRALYGIGAAWGWPWREKYRGKKEETKARMTEPESRILELRDDEETVGYCVIVGVNRTLSDRFWAGANNENIVEIEIFGFYEEDTDYGYGRYFLPRIFDALFEQYDQVYLASRSTNHHKVPKFYQDMGMTLIHQEALPLEPALIQFQRPQRRVFEPKAA